MTVTYTVDELIEYAKTKPSIDIALVELKGQYPHDRISRKRLDKVVIDGYPIIVMYRPSGELVTLDGFHRAYKAIKEGRKFIKGVLLTEKDIAILDKSPKRTLTTFKW